MDTEQPLRPPAAKHAPPRAEHRGERSTTPEEASAPISLGRDEVHVWRATLARPAPALEQAYALLAEDERRRADRFHAAGHRNRFVAAHGLLRTVLARYVEVNPQQIKFSYGPYGKPSLEGAEHCIEFNMAHSGNVALVALAHNMPLGVDVEQVREDIDVLKVGRSAFSETEYNALCALPEAERLSAFYACWSRKEAYIKALGTGVSLGLDTFDVTLHPSQAPRILRSESDPYARSRWSLHAWRLQDGQEGMYTAALCIEGTGITLQHRSV